MKKEFYPRVGYVPYSNKLDSPGDLRRFVAYARSRNLAFELADPRETYDLVILSEAADITTWCNYPHGKVIYDLIDSYLAIPRTNARFWLQGTLSYLTGRYRHLGIDQWTNIERMCKRADAIICSTREQKETIQKLNNNVHVILDVHSPLVTTIKSNYETEQTINLVWEGLPSNIDQLEQIKGALHQIGQRQSMVLNLVTDLAHPKYLNRYGIVNSLDRAKQIYKNVKIHEWSADNLASILSNCDIGIIPLNLSDAFVAGKPENKLLLMWRMGLPVIASATNAYTRALKEIGMSEFACSTEAEWIACLESLIDNKDLRREVGSRGRRFAELNHKEDTIYRLWDNVFKDLGFLQLLVDE